MEKTTKRNNFIAVLAVYFAANVIFIMSPAINVMQTELFPNEPYTSILLISTISSLCMIPGSLVAGAILGKIKYKTMALISMGGIIIFGVLPAFVHNLVAIYVFRGIVGFCIGIGFPLQSTMCLQLFNDKERPRYLGWATVSLSVGSIVFMIVSGWLADMSANYSFMFHAILLLPLILVLALLKQPTAEEIAANNVKAPSRVPEDGPMPKYAIFTAVMFAIVFFAFYTVLLNMSSICANENIGGATVAGMLLALYTVGNCIGGFMFEPLSKYVGKLVVPIGLVIWIIGHACVAFGHSVALIIIGDILSGIAVQTVWPGTVNTYSEYVPRKKQSMAVAIFVSGMNIGCFLTTYFIGAVGNITGNADPRLPVQYGFAIVLVAGIIWAIIEAARKRKMAD